MQINKKRRNAIELKGFVLPVPSKPKETLTGVFSKEIRGIFREMVPNPETHVSCGIWSDH